MLRFVLDEGMIFAEGGLPFVPARSFEGSAAGEVRLPGADGVFNGETVLFISIVHKMKCRSL